MDREAFLNTNWHIIKELYPDIAGEENPQPGSPEAESLLNNLRARTLEVMRNDPVYREIGENRFKLLSEDRQLDILQGNLKHMHAMHELQEFISEANPDIDRAS